MSKSLSRKERNAIEVVVKSVRHSRDLGWTIDNDLIAMLPQEIVYWYFRGLLTLFNKEVTRKHVNEACRAWDKTVPTPSDSVFLYFLTVCGHEFAHFWLDHSGRQSRGEISRKKAEAEAREFEDKVAEMLRFATVGEALLSERKARLKEFGVI